MNDSTTPPDIERMLKVSFGSPPRPNPAHHRGLCVCRYRDTFLWAAIRGGSLQSECSGSEKDSTLSSPLHSNCYRANEKSLIWNCLQHHFHLARSHQYEHESSSLFRLSLDKDPAKPRFSTPPQLRGGWRPFLVIEPCNLGGRNSYHPPPPTLNIYRAWSLPVVVVVGRRFVYEIFRFCYRDSVCHWLQIEKRVKTDDLLFQISIREHVISSIAMLYDPPESGFDYTAERGRRVENRQDWFNLPR